MMPTRWMPWFAASMVTLGLLAGAHGQEPVNEPAKAPGGWPHIHVDREAGEIDLDAKVVLREGEWIELIACSPNTREHEALVVVPARPSHIHLALLTLGLEPGEPLKVTQTDDGFDVTPPHGPAIEVFFVFEQDGQSRQIPANQWVINQQTDEVMADNRFLFTGSEIVNHEGRDLYMADLNGSIVSLVNFGDDLLARDTTATNKSDNQAWNANTMQIPPLGTDVILRLRPMQPQAEPDAAGQRQ